MTLILMIIISATVSAEEGKGIISRIIGFIKGLFGFGGGSGSATTTTLMCSPPYIQVGVGCCLDEDYNGICDKDEVVATTTTVKSPETTLATTTTTVKMVTTTMMETTTTTTIKIACSVNSDCGESAEVRVCYRGDVYLQSVSYLCKKPGTPESECKESRKFVGQTMMSMPPATEDCSDGCKDGVCL
ncbi:MAG: hypothetical protein ABIH11_03240 [Candidatus Altiarchaeota archaeon]